MATYLSSNARRWCQFGVWPANVLSDALDLPWWMDQNFCPSALRMGWNYDLLPWLLMVTNRATNEPEVVLILWSLSAVLSEKSDRWNHWEAETRGIRLWSPHSFNRLYVYWISPDSILYSVCFKIYSQDKGFPQMFRCRTTILARSSEIHRPRKLGNLHVGSWCRGETRPRCGWIGLTDSVGVWQMERWVMISKSSRHG